MKIQKSFINQLKALVIDLKFTCPEKKQLLELPKYQKLIYRHAVGLLRAIKEEKKINPVLFSE